MSLFSHSDILFSALHDETRAREEEEKAALQREKAALQREKENEILKTSKILNEIGSFPFEAVIDFIKRTGNAKDFLPIRALSRSLQVSWHEFQGEITIGEVHEVNTNGVYSSGDIGFDFSSITDAFSHCPNVSSLAVREFGQFNSDERLDGSFDLDSLLEVGAEQNHDVIFAGGNLPSRRPSRRVALFSLLPINDAPCLPFMNLQYLTLEGNVKLQQYTLCSKILRHITIRRNKCLIFVGISDMPSLTNFSLYRCPSLREVEMKTTSLTRLHITACQSLQISSLQKLFENCSRPLEAFLWKDMFRRGQDVPQNLREICTFLRIVAKKTRSFDLRRFSICDRNITSQLKPMKHIFDVSLHSMLQGAHLNYVSIRGSGLFTSLPTQLGAPLQIIDASSCKNLSDLLVYEPTNSNNQIEWISRVEKMVLDDCPQLSSLESLPFFSSLRWLSCQKCEAIHNDIFTFLPECIEHLDLTGCKGVGSFDEDFSSDNYLFRNLVWCSLKMTSVTPNDLRSFLLMVPEIEYINLGNLTLPSLSLESKSLQRILLINTDVSNEFTLVCPSLKELWIGNAFRGWPYRGDRLTHDEKIHGESLAKSISNTKKAKIVQIYLPEEVTFTSTDPKKECLSYTLRSFWDYGTRPSTFNGPVYYAEWDDAKAKTASRDLSNFLMGVSPSNIKDLFCITIVRGMVPGIMCSPKMNPSPPDEPWAKNYSEIGDYTSQMESDWY